jgi:hypothetical protein
LTHCETENWIFCWSQKKLMLEDGWLLQNVAGEGELEENTSSRSAICCWRWKKVGSRAIPRGGTENQTAAPLLPKRMPDSRAQNGQVVLEVWAPADWPDWGIVWTAGVF